MNILRKIDRFFTIIIIFLLNRIVFRYSFHRKSYNPFTFGEMKWFSPTVRFAYFFLIQFIVFLILFIGLAEAKAFNKQIDIYNQSQFYQQERFSTASIIKNIVTSAIYGILYIIIYFPQYFIGNQLSKYEKKDKLEKSDIKKMIGNIFIYTQSYDRVNLNNKIFNIIMPYLNEIEKTKLKHISTLYNRYLRCYKKHYNTRPYRPFSYKVKWHLNYKEQYEIQEILFRLKNNHGVSKWKIFNT